MNPNNNEILSGEPNEKITINSVEDLEKKLNTQNLPDSLKAYFSEPIQTTRGDLEQLRKKYITEKPDLKTIKAFLEKSRNVILEKSKLKLDQVKKVTGNIKESMKFEAQKIADGKETGLKADEKIDTLLGNIDKKVEKVGNSETVKKGKEKVEEAAKKAKEVTKSGVEAVKKSKGFINFIDGLEKLKEKGGLGGFFATLILFVLGVFGFNKEKLKKKAEEIEEKLNPKEIEKTKNEVRNILIKNFPGKEKYIDSVINNPKIFTKEKITTLYKKIKSGKQITLNDLTQEFKNLKIKELLKEKADKLEEEIYQKLINEIEKKYNKVLTPEQKEKIKILAKKYLKINSNTIELLNKRINQRELQIKDITPILGELGASLTKFMLGLITTGIIDYKDIIMNFADSGMKTIKLSLSNLGLSEIINTDDFYKQLEGLNDTQKSILIGLLYRKGGLFLSILGFLSATTSKLIIETTLPTQSGINGIKLLKDSLFYGNKKQIENFEKIEKALSGTKVESNGSKYLKEALKNVKEVKINFILLDFLEKSNGNTQKFYSLVDNFEKNNGINFKLEKFNSFEELQQNLAKKVKIDFATNFKDTFRGAKNKYIGFGIESALQDFNRNLEKITQAQARIALGKININIFKKAKESINIAKTSKLGDKLLFEIRSPKEAKAFLKQMIELSKKSPELIKGIFNKLPIIAVGGIAAGSEEGFFKSMSKEIKYLIPFVGPFMMIKEEGVDWKTWPPKILNPEETTVALGLFTLDGFFFTREKGLIAKGKYLVKPFTDIYDILKGTIEGGQRIYKTTRVLGTSEGIEETSRIIKQTLKEVKYIKGPAIIKAIAILAIGGYLGYETVSADDNLSDIKEYIKDGKLNINKIKKDSQTLNKQQKIELIKIIIEPTVGENIYKNVIFNINTNQLNIISKNPDIQGDWIITNKTKEFLKEIFKIDTINFKYEKPE